MSKLIVDQIQKGSSGDPLTLPAVDAAANNQPLVSSTAGVLSFSPLALPAADGDANKPVTTDGSGTLQFGGFALPTGAGTDGQVLTSTGTAAAWEAVAAPPVPNDNILSVGMVMTSSARNNVYSTGDWSSSGPYTTYYNSLSDANSITQAWNMLFGDGKPQQNQLDSSDFMYANDDGDTFHRELIFAHNRRMGHVYRDMYYNDNASTGQDYAGVTFSCIPIRNHASSGSTNCVIQTTRSVGSGNYGGAGVVYYTPTFSSGTNYANATGGSWTTLQSSTSGTDTQQYEATIPVPAQTTVLLMMSSAHRYHTTYRYKDTHGYSDLHTAFASDIMVDQRMLHALWMGRQPAAVNSANTPYELYTTCASLFGDR